MTRHNRSAQPSPGRRAIPAPPTPPRLAASPPNRTDWLPQLNSRPTGRNSPIRSDYPPLPKSVLTCLPCPTPMTTYPFPRLPTARLNPSLLVPARFDYSLHERTAPTSPDYPAYDRSRRLSGTRLFDLNLHYPTTPAASGRSDYADLAIPHPPDYPNRVQTGHHFPTCHPCSVQLCPIDCPGQSLSARPTTRPTIHRNRPLPPTVLTPSPLLTTRPDCEPSRDDFPDQFCSNQLDASCRACTSHVSSTTRAKSGTALLR